MGLEFVEDHLHSGFELAVLVGGFVGGQFFDSHIGRDAVVFDLSVAVEAVEGSARRGDVATVEQRRIVAEALCEREGLRSSSGGCEEPVAAEAWAGGLLL
jgi:hypothetical protein